MSPDTIAELLVPYLEGAAPLASGWPQLYMQLLIYLDLILKWNEHINLTAIREPEQIVRRHFGESLFVGARLGPCATLLDFGSGAGLPGIPIQLLRPEIQVTLAESRSRKAAFLQEVVRTLNLSTQVWAGRVEDMPAERQFDTVTLRAVDDMDAAIRMAAQRASRQMLILGSPRHSPQPALPANFRLLEDPVALPEPRESVLWIARKQ